SSLLRFLLRLPLPARDLLAPDEHGDGELLVVVGPRLRDGPIGRGVSLLLLRQLLEAALAVLPGALLDDRIYLRAQVRFDERIRCIIPLIKIEGAEYRLERVGEDDLARASRVLGLAL